MIFLEASHISLIEFYLCQKDGKDYFQNLENNNFNIARGKIENWSELSNFQNQSDIFSNKQELILTDVQELQPNGGQNEIITNKTEEIYLFSSTLKSWPTLAQKIFEKTGGEYLKLIFENKVASQIYLALSKQYNLQLPSLFVNQLIASCLDYQELRDKIDLIYLSPDKEKTIRWISPEIKQELFTLQLRPSNLKQDLQKWVDLVGANDIQLALSLLWTKASKLGNNELKNLVLKCDQDIKTKSKIPTTVQYKKLLFQIGLIQF
jgi:hypothetical protein